MIDIHQLFASIKPDLFLPPTLAKIKEYLKVDQVFIYQLNLSGHLKRIISTSEINVDKKYFGDNLDEIITSLIKQINKGEKSYYNHYLDDISKDTIPIEKAELFFPIKVKTKEIISLNENVKNWGILAIYDYDYKRQWNDTEINAISKIVDYITLAIERAIIYDKLIQKEEQCQSYYLLDDNTGLANYDAFIDCLDYEWRRLTREKQPLSLILFQLKFTNEISKRILGKIGYFIQEEIKRPADLGAYFGDNKIIVMLPNTDENGALWVKKKIVQSLAKITNSHEIFDCLSYVETLIPNNGQDYHSVLKNLENSLTSLNE